MLKRDLSYELFSRDPEGWAEWAKRAPAPYGTPLQSMDPPPRITSVGAPINPPGRDGKPRSGHRV